MSDIFSCLPQNRHLMDVCSNISDVKPFSQVGRPQVLFDDYIALLPIERQKRINDRAARLINKIKK